MLKSINPASDKEPLAPSFNKRAFDMESFQELNGLHQNELLATLIFTYIMKLDNPVKMFADDPSCLDKDESITKNLYVDDSGCVSSERTSKTFFEFSLTLDINVLHKSYDLLLEPYPNPTQEQESNFSLDAFLMQLVPQLWDQSQYLTKKLDSATRDAMQIKAAHYSVGSGHSAYTIFEKILTPTMSMLNKYRDNVH